MSGPSRIIGDIIRVALVAVFDLLVIIEGRKIALNEDLLLHHLRVQAFLNLESLQTADFFRCGLRHQ
jgi:hypothetical protein